MEEIAAVHPQAVAAEAPVRAQQEVVPKDAMLFGRQYALADQAEIGCVLLALAAEGASSFEAFREVQRHAPNLVDVRRALTELVVALPKDRPEYAMAGDLALIAL